MSVNSKVRKKTVLCITAGFPPYAGSGGQRMLKFCKNLGHFGWQSVVLTRRPTPFETQDKSLVDEIPEDCEVHQTKSWDPASLADRLCAKKKIKSEEKGGVSRGCSKGFGKTLWDFFKNWILTPHPFLLWMPFACREAERIVRARHIDVILSDSRIACLSAYFISRKHDIPYIIDYRNAWVGDPHLHMPTFLHRAFNEWLETKILRNASAAVFLADATRQDTLERYPFYDASRTFLIPNGYDKKDFDCDVRDKADQPFTIGYVGSIYPHYLPPFRVFCQALRRLVPDCDTGSVRLRMVGRICKEVGEVIAGYDLSEITCVEGYMRHADAIRFLLESHVLLLMLDQPEDNRKVSVPGKIYEYMASGKKILYIGPDCETSKIMEKYELGVCAFADADKAYAALRGWKQAYNQGKLPRNPPDIAEPFERRALTKRLVGVFDMVLKENKV